MEDTVSIKECEKLYPDEWLLFEVNVYYRRMRRDSFKRKAY